MLFSHVYNSCIAVNSFLAVFLCVSSALIMRGLQSSSQTLSVVPALDAIAGRCAVCGSESRRLAGLADSTAGWAGSKAGSKAGDEAGRGRHLHAAHPARSQAANTA